jgi:hypothetical protein
MHALWSPGKTTMKGSLDLHGKHHGKVKTTNYDTAEILHANPRKNEKTKNVIAAESSFRTGSS